MIDLNLRGPDLAKLEEYSDRIIEWMKDDPRFVDMDTSLSLRKPELRVKIDRERASDLAIPAQDNRHDAERGSSAACPSPSTRNSANSTTSGSAPSLPLPRQAARPSNG